MFLVYFSLVGKAIHRINLNSLVSVIYGNSDYLERNCLFCIQITKLEVFGSLYSLAHMDT